MLAIIHVEDVLDFEDVGFVQAWSLVGCGVEFRLDGLCFLTSAHILSINNKKTKSAAAIVISLTTLFDSHLGRP